MSGRFPQEWAEVVLKQIGYKITELCRLEKILKHIDSCCKPGTSKFTAPYILSSYLEEGKKINPGVSHHVWGEQGQLNPRF